VIGGNGFIERRNLGVSVLRGLRELGANALLAGAVAPVARS
jgi:hypothetical protein